MRNTPTDDPTDPPDPAREALITTVRRRLEECEARLGLIDTMLDTTIVLSLEECAELRALQAQPFVWTGSPAVGGAIHFVRHLAARLPGRS